MQRKHMFKKILVPIDGSPSSLIAQELTALIAGKLNSKVTVLHVVSHEFMTEKMRKLLLETRDRVPPLMGTTPTPQFTSQKRLPAPSSTSLSEEIAGEVTAWYHQRGEEIVEEAMAFFKEASIPVGQKLIDHADPSETIIREAKKGNYDLVAIGQSEEEQEPHLGSVAKKVSRHVQTPILIARRKRQISKMLVPIDGSEYAEKAARYAGFMAKKIGAKVTLLYVQESGIFNLRPEVTRAVGTRILSNAAKQFEGLELDQELKSGDPAKIITKTANKEDYDLIVMGSRGLGVVERFLLGSVSDHVIHYANLPVLVIK